MIQYFKTPTNKKQLILGCMKKIGKLTDQMDESPPTALQLAMLVYSIISSAYLL